MTVSPQVRGNDEPVSRTCLVRPSEWAALQALAAAQHRSASAQLRYLIEQATAHNDEFVRRAGKEPT